MSREAEHKNSPNTPYQEKLRLNWGNRRRGIRTKREQRHQTLQRASGHRLNSSGNHRGGNQDKDRKWNEQETEPQSKTGSKEDCRHVAHIINHIVYTVCSIWNENRWYSSCPIFRQIIRQIEADGCFDESQQQEGGRERVDTVSGTCHSSHDDKKSSSRKTCLSFLFHGTWSHVRTKSTAGV